MGLETVSASEDVIGGLPSLCATINSENWWQFRTKEKEEVHVGATAGSVIFCWQCVLSISYSVLSIATSMITAIPCAFTYEYFTVL